VLPLIKQAVAASACMQASIASAVQSRFAETRFAENTNPNPKP